MGIEREVVGIFDFDNQFRKAWTDFEGPLEERCLLSLCDEEGLVLGSREMSISGFYFQRICGQLTMIFTEDRWLSKFISPELKCDKEARTITVKFEKGDGYYKIQFKEY